MHWRTLMASFKILWCQVSFCGHLKQRILKISNRLIVFASIDDISGLYDKTSRSNTVKDLRLILRVGSFRRQTFCRYPNPARTASACCWIPSAACLLNEIVKPRYLQSVVRLSLYRARFEKLRIEWTGSFSVVWSTWSDQFWVAVTRCCWFYERENHNPLDPCALRYLLTIQNFILSYSVF